MRDLEVNFKPLSVLFGPNAAGKSNVLDALQLLSRIATSRTLKEAFEPPYRGTPLESFSFGLEGVKSLLAKDTESFVFEVDVKLSDAVVEAVNHQIQEMKQIKPGGSRKKKKSLALVKERFLRYRIEVEVLPRTGFFRVRNEYLAALYKKGDPTASRLPFLELKEDRLHLRMEGQAHPTYYERYLDHSILSLPLYPPHYPHLVAMRQELTSWFFFYFEPRERMRTFNPVKEVRHIGLMGEELAAFLNTLKAEEPRQFKGVEKSLQKLIPSITGIKVDINNLGQVELELMERDTPIPASVLSEGTLRILGLLALGGVKEPPALLGFEEPENGIHPRRISLISELLKTYASRGNTQIIVTTHSPVLLDLIPEDSLLICRKDEDRTTIQSFNTLGPLMRRKDIDQALITEDESPLPSELILRGDLDA